jgi:hypothetical protein
VSDTATGTPVTVEWGGRSTTVSSNPEPQARPGRHAWTAILVFDLTDPDRALILDSENLRSVVVTCWWCRASTDDGTPCPGVPV